MGLRGPLPYPKARLRIDFVAHLRQRRDLERRLREGGWPTTSNFYQAMRPGALVPLSALNRSRFATLAILTGWDRPVFEEPPVEPVREQLFTVDSLPAPGAAR